MNANKIALLTKVKKLLDRAIQITKNEQSLAESNFHMARYYHSQNQIGEAHRVILFFSFKQPQKFSTITSLVSSVTRSSFFPSTDMDRP